MLQVTLSGQIVFANDEPPWVIVKSQKIPKELAAETQKVIDAYFPELCGVLLYFTGTSNGKYLGDWKIALNPNLLKKPKRKLHHTIGHELTHLIQYQQDKIRERAIQTEYAYLYTQTIPKGEEACEIWTYARHSNLIAPSGYFHIPFEMRDNEPLEEFWNRKLELYEQHCNEIHELAKKAIELRRSGKRNYIRWFLGELESIFDEFPIF